jgi:uncharacterized coiled-coil protein SlyX
MSSTHLDAEEGVSPATAAALRAAMNRLFAGKPQRTDGRLVKENLRREADVSHATMHRALKIMAEWDDLKAIRGGVTVGEARRDDEIDKLKTRLAEKTRECTRLQQQLDAAANAIAALHHDNLAMHEDLNTAGSITDLQTRRARHDRN